MTTIAWNPGHGWSEITNARDNSYIGNGANPSFTYCAPTAMCHPLGRNPQVGDIIDMRFSSDLTPEVLEDLGLKVSPNGEVCPL